MKILFVTEHFHPYTGGAEELFLGLANELVTDAHEVTVITTLHDDALPKAETLNGIKIHRIKCNNRYLFTVMSLPLLIQLARKCDLIHTTSYNAAVPSFIAGKITGKKVVITFHEVWGKLWFKLPFTRKAVLFLYFIFEKMVLQLPFQRYVAVSQFTGNTLLKSGINESKVHVIYNGTDYANFSKYAHREPEVFTICFFGRLGLSKGIDLLLEASAIFFKKHPEAKLKLIIPTYPEKLFRKVKKIPELLQIGKHIIMMHDLDKDILLKEVSTSSCVVIPSLSEGFCYTAVEAVAMNVPIISSGKGALKEVVGGRHMHLTDLNVAGLVDALERAKNNQWKFTEPVKFTRSACYQLHLKMYGGLIS